MNRFFATFMRAYQSPETGGEGAAGGGALDIESRISAVLSGNEGDDIDEQGGEQGGHQEEEEQELDPEDQTKQSKPKPEDDDAAGEDDDQTLAAAFGLS